MKFGIFYELQLPKPWGADDEHQLVQDALAQVELADRLGLDYAWAVEHHFLEEYSHCSASDVFLAAAAARTKRIRLGHGIRQVIPNYNHPARTAEAIAMLDLVSNGRAELGIGEGATRLELGGFNIPAKEKRPLSRTRVDSLPHSQDTAPVTSSEPVAAVAPSAGEHFRREGIRVVGARYRELLDRSKRRQLTPVERKDLDRAELALNTLQAMGGE
jgi:alkanesulfonate monooxygenase SsuD/methylene tetrahydromethanopterin reductase-like flavin-dependent oxidoreductase (luciferase family)